MADHRSRHSGSGTPCRDDVMARILRPIGPYSDRISILVWSLLFNDCRICRSKSAARIRLKSARYPANADPRPHKRHSDAKRGTCVTSAMRHPNANPKPGKCHSEAKRGIWANREPRARKRSAVLCLPHGVSCAAPHVGMTNKLNRHVYVRDHGVWEGLIAGHGARLPNQIPPPRSASFGMTHGADLFARNNADEDAL
jgi:hypothetical protein